MLQNVSQPQPSPGMVRSESTVIDTNKAKIRVNKRTGREFVNQYEIYRKLGEGAYGTVYLCVDVKSNPTRKVALKTMNTKQLMKKKGSEKAARSVLEGFFLSF